MCKYVNLKQADVHMSNLVLFTAPPSPPQNLNVMGVTSRSVTLQWLSPASDGGSEVIGKT